MQMIKTRFPPPLGLSCILLLVLFFHLLEFPKAMAQDSIATDSYPLAFTDSTVRTSLIFTFNPNMTQFTELMGFEFIYAQKINNYWIEGLISQTTAAFDYNSKPKEEETKDPLLTIGLGATLKTPLTQIGTKILSSGFFSGLSHSVGSFITYNSLQESFRDTTYVGFGFRAEYGLYFQLGKSSQWGAKFSLNAASLKRGEDFPNEASNDRRLILAWPHLALDYSYYF